MGSFITAKICAKGRKYFTAIIVGRENDIKIAINNVSSVCEVGKEYKVKLITNNKHRTGNYEAVAVLRDKNEERRLLKAKCNVNHMLKQMENGLTINRKWGFTEEAFTPRLRTSEICMLAYEQDTRLIDFF